MKIIHKSIYFLIVLLILGGVVSQGAAFNLAPDGDLPPPQPTPREPQDLPTTNVPESDEAIHPQAQLILQEIARKHGIPAERLLLGYFEEWELPLIQRSFSYVKAVDQVTGKSYGLGLGAEGGFVDPEALRQAERQAYNATFGKLHPSLVNHLNGAEAHTMVKVSIWLDMGGRDASIERINLNAAESVSAAELEQRRADGIARATQLHRAVEQPLIDFLPSVGGRLISAADTAPLVFVELPAQAIQQVAALSYVQVIDLLVEGGPDQDGGTEKTAGGIEMATASLASKSDIVEARGFNGSGLTVAVVEGDSIEFDNPYIVNGTCGPTSTCPSVDEHATAVGGIIGSTHSTARGTAPGIGTGLLSANGSGWDLSNMQTATTWGLNSDTEVFNNSYYLETDGVMHNSDRWMDYIVRNYWVLEVKSAGNRGESDDHVTSPGLGYNSLTVGAAEDKNTVTWDDDAMAELSSWDEPAGREKPEVTAIGCGEWNSTLGGVPGIVITGMVDPWIYDQGCGTSYAAPIVAGGGALLIDRASTLESWPEAQKAILIATALHNIEGDQRISEIDGAGAVDLAAADILAANGWYNGMYLTPGSFDASYNYNVRTIHLYAGERVRVALAYDSYPSADYTTDVLQGDLDILLLNSSGTTVASSSGVDSWEIIDYTVAAEGDYTIRLRNYLGSLAGDEWTYAGIAVWPGHYVLTPYQPQARDVPPGLWDQDSGDDYRFTRGSFWNAVGLRSPAGSDYDIFLFKNSVYGDPADHALLEDSSTGLRVDFVVVDGNHALTGNYYTTISTYTGTGNYYTEHATWTADLGEGSYGPYSMTSSQVVRVWDSNQTAGVRKYYALKPTAGDADLGMALFGSTEGTTSTYYQGRSTALAQVDITGAGAAEATSYQASVTDYFGLVVWNNSATLTTSFYIYADTSAPTGSISINSGAAYTTSTSVTLNLSATDTQTGVNQMRFSNDNISWSGWEAYSTSKTYSLPAGDGTKTVYVQFKNNAEMTSASYADTIVLDTTPPTGSIIINGGAGYTTSTSVTLTLSASDAVSGVYQMRFSNDNATWSTWEAYATSKPWTLIAGDGSKTVYVQFKNNAGLSSGSYSDSIVLDTTPPTGSIVINGGATYATSTSVTLTLSASDAGSGVSQMRFSNDNATWSTWEAYGTSKAWTLSAGDGSKTVYVQYRDNAGLASGSYSDGITLDSTAPTGSISINSGATYTTSASVTLTLSATDSLSGVSQMHFSNDNSTWSTWESYTTSKAWTLSAGDGSKTVYVQYRDNAGNVSSSYSDGITLDSTAPTGSILINGGALYTSGGVVTLSISASDALSGVSQMRLSNDNATWNAWETYATTKSWTLLSGDGTKTVYVQFRDNAGNSSGSFSDSIILDTLAPTGSIVINGGATYATSTSVTLTLSASDAGSGVSQMRFSNDNVSWSTWEAYSTSKSWSLSAGDGSKTVYVQYKDNAGLASGSYSDGITLDSTAPTGSISINSGATYTTSASVTLTLSATDSLSGVSQMHFSNDNSTWSTWETYSTSKSWALSAGDGSKTVYVQYRDNAGNVSSSYSDGITLDSTAPTGSILINAGALYTSSTSVTLTLSATDALSGISQMRFSNDNASWTAWETYATSRAYTLPSGDGSKTVYVQYRDNAGNSSTSYSDSIILDTVAPTGSIVINSGAAYTTSPTVTLSLSATDAGSGVSQMRFSNDNVSWSTWEAYSTSKSWTLSVGDGAKTVYVQYRDNSGLTSGSYSDGITLDATGPTCSIIINGGAIYTSSASVTLAISATDATSGVFQMRFSPDNSTWSPWEAYATSKAWTLTVGDGSKTVYGQISDHAGNINGCNDVIVLDTVAPSGTILINAGDAYTYVTSVMLTLSATDTLSGISQMRFSNDNLTWSDWEGYATSKVWPLSAGDGNKTVYVQYRDVAGNSSTSYSDSIILETLPPTGTIIINAGATYATSAAVTLTLSATDPGSGVYQMRFSNDNASWSVWEAYATSKAWALTAGDGSKMVYVQYKDNAGNASTSFSDGIILDSTAPSGSISVNSGAAYTTNASVTLSLSASDALSGVFQMRFSNDNSSWSGWEAYSTSKAWTLSAGDGSKTVYVQYSDNAGNISTSFSDGITLDSTAPTGNISINGGAVYATSTSVTLSLSASDGLSGVTQMQFSNDNLTWSTWEAYATSKSWTLPAGDGSKTVYARFRDAAGNISDLYQDSILLDVEAPTGSILINAGAVGTNQVDVTLTLSAADPGSGVLSMRFSNDGSSWSDWEAYALTKSWTLSATNGTKTVYVQYQDYNAHVSTAYTDTILLDDIAPLSTATSPSISVRMYFAVTWSGTDNLTGIASYDVQYRVGLTGEWTDWLLGTTETSAIFGHDLPVTVIKGQTYYFRVRAHDLAGNVEEYPEYDTFTTVIEGHQILIPFVFKLQ